MREQVPASTAAIVAMDTGLQPAGGGDRDGRQVGERAQKWRKRDSNVETRDGGKGAEMGRRDKNRVMGTRG